MPAINKKYYRNFSVFIVCLTALSITPNCFASSGEFQINCPYWYIWFDRAGYVDLTYYYPSPRHQVDGYHEMMTGDWAAAVWYQGIKQGSSQAQWFTEQFIIPDITTYTPFIKGDYSVFNSSCNPVWTDPCQPNPPPYNPGTKSDSGWSDVNDSKLQVKIFYEVVDLGQQDANGVGGSPMTFRDPNGNPVYVYSERYVLLLTYQFKNISASDINNLEFYQMLHGHPADLTYGTNCTYETTGFDDPLANYVSCDSNHHTGKFRYDMTLWNEPTEWEPNHVDWMGFSSTIEPNAVDCNTFEYQGEGMEYNVTHRVLHGLTELHGNQLAGAMKWNLGNLSPGQTKSITLALMYGAGPIHTTPPEWDCVTLTKTDDVNDGDCVVPFVDPLVSDYLNYTICYSTTCDINDVNIVDTLPAYVEFVDANGGGVYEPNSHTVRWNLHNIEANDSNCFALKVKVAEDAPQGNYLTNIVKMFSGSSIIKTATKYTQVCCEYTRLYVKKDANGPQTGHSWSEAYYELRDALQHVDLCTQEIWVAKGTYKPANVVNRDANFAMLDGIDMYGHFAGWEDSIEQRNLADANNETILTGDIDDNNTCDAYKVVTAADSRIDGFTIKKGSSYGIYSSDCSPTIVNCVVRFNTSYGILLSDGADATVINTFINNNSSYGIWSNGSGTSINIDRCTVGPNNDYGLIMSMSCMVNTTDSIFSGNTYYGILAGGGSNLTVERCDISDNNGVGILCDESIAVIQRCRIQRNASDGLQRLYASDVVLKLNIISDNNLAGVYTGGGYHYGGNCQIIDNMIYSNDSNGIELCDSYYYDIGIRNNTIVKNNGYGIHRSNYSPEPNINCNIIYDNNLGSLYGSFGNVNYNCIQGSFSGGTNINQNPQFRDIDANDYHLTDDSNCIDAGDPNFSSSTETDIDGEARVIYGRDNNRVDMGADEYYWSPADFDKNGIVNFIDYVPFARSWRLIDANISLDDDNDVDFIDFSLFCADWLWEPAWLLGFDIGGEGAYFAEGFGNGEMMMSMQTEQEFMSESAAFEVEQTVDVNELVDWLDELWQTDEGVRDSTSETDWQEFIENVKQSQ